MTFKKLALATAIAALPAAGYSLEVLDEGALAETTGQDGIEMVLNIGTNGIQTDIWLHDTDGLNSGTSTLFTNYSFDGAIVIDNMAVGVGGAAITINIDAGDNATSGSAPILNVQVNLPTALTIATGDIRVANSQRDNASTWGIETSGNGYSGIIFSNMTIVLGNTSLNINLGNETQTGSASGTDMIAITASVTNGLLINNFRLNDATNSGDGGIGATYIQIDDSGAGANLTLGIDVNASDAGLEIGLGQVGNASTGMDINIARQYLGSTSSGVLGDVSIIGLNVNGSTLTISGK